MKIGFLGAGKIAGVVAPTVAALEGAECWAVGAGLSPGTLIKQEGRRRLAS